MPRQSRACMIWAVMRRKPWLPRCSMLAQAVAISAPERLPAKPGHVQAHTQQAERADSRQRQPHCNLLSFAGELVQRNRANDMRLRQAASYLRQPHAKMHVLCSTFKLGNRTVASTEGPGTWVARLHQKARRGTRRDVEAAAPLSDARVLVPPQRRAAVQHHARALPSDPRNGSVQVGTT